MFLVGEILAAKSSSYLCTFICVQFTVMLDVVQSNLLKTFIDVSEGVTHIITWVA